ncbi:hypothetical protein M0657_001248 [Pyricularia oryzae]|uniref:Galactose oxidase n=2 Tax=Pyricularia oryzae TaxID=318829 RepID=A0AA97PJL5_PYRO3|nr:hypothetical protein OOU_Y34scaffold00624g30 [Pyricularia oryzae Y34]KAI7924379.1 hypothetical protein M9X92_003824 [Pyricularia oryzae]KAI7931294.1 hypothetical protein M0657_001248 [Pyricularia oryzae]
MFPRRNTRSISELLVRISVAFNLAQCQQSHKASSTPFNCSDCSGKNATLALSLNEKWKSDDITLDTLNRGGLLARDAVHTNARWASEGMPGNAQSYKIFNWGGKARYKDDDPRYRAPPPLIRLTPSRVGTMPATTEGGWAVVAKPLNTPETILRTDKGARTTCKGVGYLLGGVTPYSKGEDAIPGPGDAGPGAHSLPEPDRTGLWLPPPALSPRNLSKWRRSAIRTWGLVQIDRVYMYDIATEKLYMQPATGGGVDGTPEVRRSPCAVAAGSHSGGTYEVVVFVGSDKGEVSSDVHVVTIPGFQWFRVPNTDKENKPMDGHQCTVVGDGQRQMLSLGGNVDGVDPWRDAIEILDMTELK